MYVLIDGVRFSFGVLYVELLSTFKAGKGETAWIGSILIGVYNLGGRFLLVFFILINYPIHIDVKCMECSIVLVKISLKLK